MATFEMDLPEGIAPYSRRWEKFEERKYCSTKFFDLQLVRALGLEESIRTFMGNGGLGGLVDLAARTYPALVREFLATFEPADDGWSFRLNGQRFELSTAGFREAFGITSEPTAGWRDFAMMPQSDQLWEAVTGQVIRPSHDSNSSILHPGLRLCHKVLASTFFGQSETNKVSQGTWVWMSCLLPGVNVVPDWVELFFDTCKIMCRSQGRTTSKTIAFGGLITLIAFQVGVDEFDDYLACGETWKIDHNHLRKGHTLIPQREGFIWTAGPGQVHRLHLPRPLPTGPTAAHLRLLPDNQPPPQVQQEEEEEEEEHMNHDHYNEQPHYEEPYQAPHQYFGGASSSHGGFYCDYPSHGYFESAFRSIQDEQAGIRTELGAIRGDIATILANQQEERRAAAADRRMMNELIARFNQSMGFPPPHDDE